jgi:CrcB protein
MAGAAGALARWGLSRFVQRVAGTAWPYGTLAVNVLGCFFFGLVIAAFRDRVPADSPWRLLLLTGFAGAFTTYSTFAFESWELASDRHLLGAAVNVALHLGLGLAAVGLGLISGRIFQ